MKPQIKRRDKPEVLFNGKKLEGIKSFVVKDFGGWVFYFCRGSACPRTPTQRRLCKQKCDQCIVGRPGETLRQITERMIKGE